MKMKKYILSLICVGIVVGSIGAAAGLSYISSRSKKPDETENLPASEEVNRDAHSASDETAPPAVRESPLRIKPSTKIIYEYFYQADNRIETNEKDPPYFLLDQSRDTVEEYFTDWDIVEFNESQVKLRKTFPGLPEAQYVLGVKDNYVAVYQKSNTGKVSLKEITATPVSSLSADEQNKLMTGINVKSDDHLAKMLEDYGS